MAAVGQFSGSETGISGMALNGVMRLPEGQAIMREVAGGVGVTGGERASTGNLGLAMGGGIVNQTGVELQ